MKNLQSNLLGRLVTVTDDTANRPYSIVAIWLPDGQKTPFVALEPVNQFGKSTGGALVTADLTQITIR